MSDLVTDGGVMICLYLHNHMTLNFWHQKVI